MAVKTFNPTSPAVRGMTVADYSVITKKTEIFGMIISVM